MTFAFSGKKILFVGPETFGYEKKIISSLEQLGAEVTFVGERSEGLIYRFARCVGLDKYYKLKLNNKILKTATKKRFDFLFVIRGEMLCVDTVFKVKAQWPSLLAIMYQWDSSVNNDYVSLIPEFDIVASFDPKDCQRLGLIYHPLFFSDEYSKELESYDLEMVYDSFFFGSLHGDRLEVLENLSTYFEGQGMSLYAYIYVPFFTWIKKIFINQEKNSQGLSFKKLCSRKVRHYYGISRTIIDVNSETQSGLTMRTFESLAFGKKLITTNLQIKKEPFFDESWIYILDRKNPHVDVGWVRAIPSSNKPDMSQYHINNWLVGLFSFLSKR